MRRGAAHVVTLLHQCRLGHVQGLLIFALPLQQVDQQLARGVAMFAVLAVLDQREEQPLGAIQQAELQEVTRQLQLHPITLLAAERGACQQVLVDLHRAVGFAASAKQGCPGQCGSRWCRC